MDIIDLVHFRISLTRIMDINNSSLQIKKITTAHFAKAGILVFYSAIELNKSPDGHGGKVW